MPNYTSHILMAEDVFNQLQKSLEVEVIPKDFYLSSLGQDFTFFDSQLFEKTHNEKVQAFFINLMSYIIDNKLQQNPKIMAYLYGHIAHFCLDSTLHPLVYAKEKEIKKTTLFSVHTTIEYLIDQYLSSHTNNQNSIKTLLKEENFLEDQLNRMIDYLYFKTYNKKNTSKTYKRTLWALKHLDQVSNIPIKNQTLLSKLLNYSHFFQKNKTSSCHLFNQNHQEWKNPFSGEVSRESIDELYKKSIVKALELSEKANQFLYQKASLQKVNLAFDDISYDTGINCSQGKRFIYTNKKI